MASDEEMVGYIIPSAFIGFSIGMAFCSFLNWIKIDDVARAYEKAFQLDAVQNKCGYYEADNQGNVKFNWGEKNVTK